MGIDHRAYIPAHPTSAHRMIGGSPTPTSVGLKVALRVHVQTRKMLATCIPRHRRLTEDVSAYADTLGLCPQIIRIAEEIGIHHGRRRWVGISQLDRTSRARAQCKEFIVTPELEVIFGTLASTPTPRELVAWRS